MNILTIIIIIIILFIITLSIKLSGYSIKARKYGTITTSTGEITNNDEILKLQKKNRELEQEVEILKKAVAIFSKK